MSVINDDQEAIQRPSASATEAEIPETEGAIPATGTAKQSWMAIINDIPDSKETPVPGENTGRPKMSRETIDALLKNYGHNPESFRDPVPVPTLPDSLWPSETSTGYRREQEQAKFAGMSNADRFNLLVARRGEEGARMYQMRQYDEAVARELDNIFYPENDLDEIAKTFAVGVMPGIDAQTYEYLETLNKSPEGKKELKKLWTEKRVQDVMYANAIEYLMFEAGEIEATSAAAIASFRRGMEDTYGGKLRATANLGKDFAASGARIFQQGAVMLAQGAVYGLSQLGPDEQMIRSRYPVGPLTEEQQAQFEREKGQTTAIDRANEFLLAQSRLGNQFYSRPEAKTGSFLYDYLASPVASGLGSVVPALATFAANPALGTALMWGANTGEVYNGMKDENIPDETALPLSYGAGAIMSLLDRVGVNRIFKAWQTPAPIGKAFKQGVVEPFFGELVPEGLQSVTQSAATEVALMMDPDYEFNPTRAVNAIYQAGAESLYGGIVGGITGGLGSHPFRAAIKQADYRDAQKRIMGGIERIKKSPDIHKNGEMVKRAVNDISKSVGAPESVWIDAEKFISYFQGDAGRMRKAMIDMDVTQQQLDSARLSGAQVEVNADGLMLHSAAVEQDTELAKWAQPEPDAPTIATISQQIEMESEMQTEYARIQSENMALPTPFRIMRDQLMDAGLSAEEAKHDADLALSMATVAGKRIGITAEQFLDLNPIKISLAGKFKNLEAFKTIAEYIETGKTPPPIEATQAVQPQAQVPTENVTPRDVSAWAQEAIDTLVSESGIDPQLAQGFQAFARQAIESGDMFDAKELARQFETGIAFAQGLEQAAGGLARIISQPGQFTPEVQKAAGVGDMSPTEAMAELQRRQIDLMRRAQSFRNLSENPQAVDQIRQIMQGDANQEYKEGRRGSVTFTPDVDIIRLFNGRQDSSTILHEMYHVFNKHFVDAAKSPDADAQLVTDFNTLNESVGGGLDSSDPDVRRKAEEAAADKFEKYLYEGKAPSPALADAFKRFRTWFTNAYRQVKEFVGIELSPEVSGVFDRMIATQEEISQAQSFYHDSETLAPPTGSTPEQSGEVVTRAQKARTTTEERQFAKTVDQFIGGAEGRKILRNQAREEVNQKRQYQAATALRNMGGLSYEDVANEIGDADAKKIQENHKGVINDEPKAAKDNTERLKKLAKEYDFESYEQMIDAAVNMDIGATLMEKISNLGGLDEFYITRQYGKEAADKIRQQFGDKAVRREGGVTGAMMAAETFNYVSVQNMLSDIAMSPNRAEAVRQTYQGKLAQAEAIVRQAMAQDSSTPVDEAYHNDDLSRAMRAKQAILDEQAREQAHSEGKRTHRQLSDMALKRVAQETVASKSGRKGGQYLTAVEAYRRHAEAAARADAMGDKIKAAAEYQQVRLNHYIIRESIQAKKDVDRFAKKNTNVNDWIRRLEGKGQHVPAPVIESYREAIKDILRTFKVITSPRLAPLPETMKGTTVNIPGSTDPEIASLAPSLAESTPEWILNRQGADKITSWKDLTVGQIRELGESLDSLVQQGKGEMTALRMPGIETTAAAIRDSINRMSSRKERPKRYGRGTKQDTIGNKLGSLYDSFLNKAIVPEYLMSVADGNSSIRGKGMGPLQNMVVVLGEQAGKKNTMFVQDAAKIRPNAVVLEQYAKRFKNMDKSRFGPVPMALREAYGFGLEWDAEMCQMIAFNVGTANNIRAITGGYGMTVEQVKAILSTFNSQEVAALQNMLDVMGSHFDETDAVHYRLYNKHIKKEPSQAFGFINADGKASTLEGYFPLIYDGTVDPQVGDRHDYEVALQRGAMIAVRGTPKVQKGHTISRVGAERPPLLKMDVIYKSLNAQAQFIHMAEAIHEANMITNDGDWRRAFEKYFGETAYREVRDFIKYNADPDMANLGNNDLARSILNWMRRKATTAALGFRATTALKQGLDIFPAMLHITLHSRTGASGLSAMIGGIRDIAFARDGQTMRQRMQTIKEKSAFMRDASGNPSADIREMINRTRGDVKSIKILGKDITYEGVLGTAFWFMSQVDDVARSIAWTAGYKTAMNGNGDFDINALREKGTSESDIEKMAIRFADGVAKTFSATTTADMSRWQRDKGVMNLFSTFMTGTVRRSSRLYQYIDAYSKGQMTTTQFAEAFVMDAAIQAWIPALFAMALKSTIGGDDDKDKAGILDIAFDVFFDPMLSIIDGVPFFNMASAAARYRRGDVLTPAGISEAGRRINQLVGIPKNISKDEWDKAAWKTAALIGYASGIPAENMVKEGKKALETIGIIEKGKK